MNREERIAKLQELGARVVDVAECAPCSTLRHYGPGGELGTVSVDKLDVQTMANMLLSLALDPGGAGHRVGSMCAEHRAVFARIVAACAQGNGLEVDAVLERIGKLFTREEPAR